MRIRADRPKKRHTSGIVNMTHVHAALMPCDISENIGGLSQGGRIVPQLWPLFSAYPPAL